MNKKVEIYLWNRLSFPMHLNVRPQSEMLKAFVEKCLKQDNKNFTVRLYKETEIEGETTSHHWTWEFPQSITEERRLEIQALFEDYFGESGRDFRWEGTHTYTVMSDVFTMGKYIQ
jgi:hypothetical protein